MFEKKSAIAWGAILLIIGFFLPWTKILGVGVVNGFDMFRYTDAYAKRVPKTVEEKRFNERIKSKVKTNDYSKISQEKFENWVIYRLKNKEEQSYIKNSYALDKKKKVYNQKSDASVDKEKIKSILKKVYFQDKVFIEYAYYKLYFLNKTVTKSQKSKLFEILKLNHFMNIAPKKIDKNDFEKNILAKIKNNDINAIQKMKFEQWILNNIRKNKDKELVQNSYSLDESANVYKLKNDIESAEKAKISKILKKGYFQDKEFIKRYYYFDSKLNSYRLRATVKYVGRCRVCDILLKVNYINIVPEKIPAKVFQNNVLNNSQITSHANYGLMKSLYKLDKNTYYLNVNITGSQSRRLKHLLGVIGFRNISVLIGFFWSLLPWLMLVCAFVSLMMGGKEDKTIAKIANYAGFASLILFILLSGFSILGTGILISLLGGLYLPLAELLIATKIVKQKDVITKTDQLQEYLRKNTGKLVKKKKTAQKIAFSSLIALLLVVATIVFFIFIYLIAKGAGYIDGEMLFGYGDRGLIKAIIGTFLVTIITALIGVPIGVSTAIYLNEYARQNKLNRMIRLAIRTLSGVPSVVYGLFGLIIFVRMMHMPTSIIASGLTLGLMTIPWVISSSEEALRSIPMGYREGSLALGASKWYTIRKNVLPYAISGIITGGIIGLARAAGETAPIMFTGAASIAPLKSFPRLLMADFEALSYKIYYFASVDPNMFKLRGVVYATCLILILLVLILMITAIIIRYRLRKKYQIL